MSLIITNIQKKTWYCGLLVKKAQAESIKRVLETALVNEGAMYPIVKPSRAQNGQIILSTLSNVAFVEEKFAKEYNLQRPIVCTELELHFMVPVYELNESAMKTFFPQLPGFTMKKRSTDLDKDKNVISRNNRFAVEFSYSRAQALAVPGVSASEPDGMWRQWFFRVSRRDGKLIYKADNIAEMEMIAQRIREAYEGMDISQAIQ